MIQFKSARFRLYPTPEQNAQMAQTAGACRFVYNIALEQRAEWWRPERKINVNSQCREVTMLRAEVDWLKAAPSQALQQALRDLDGAFVRYGKNRVPLKAEETKRKAQGTWRPRKDGKPLGYPSPRKKGLDDTFRFPDPVSLKFERTGKSSGRIKMPKIGCVALRGWQELPGDICSVTVSRKAGQWFASVLCEREVEAPTPSALPPVGIDMGITVFAALSNGKNIEPTNVGRKAQRALRKAQRALSRKKKGSNNRRKARQRVARIHQRVADARKDFVHKQTTAIANSHSVVVVEALNIKNMSASAKGTTAEPGRKVAQKSGLNRSILDQGWGMFRMMLGWKLAERGGQLIQVSAAYTSQSCSECGTIDAKSRVSQSRFECTGCGHVANADTNAAKNILQRGLDQSLKLVEGHRAKRPCEARSIRRAA